MEPSPPEKPPPDPQWRYVIGVLIVFGIGTAGIGAMDYNVAQAVHQHMAKRSVPAAVPPAESPLPPAWATRASDASLPVAGEVFAKPLEARDDAVPSTF